MRILILTPQIPWPPHQGASLRNFNIIQGLVANGAQVSLLSFAEHGQLDVDLEPLTNLLDQFVPIPVPHRSNLKRFFQLISSPLPDMGHRLYHPEFLEALEQLLTSLEPEVVQIEGIELGQALDVVKKVNGNSTVVFDNHNAETALQQRIYETDIQILSKLPKAIYSRMQVRKLDRFEGWLCREADVVTAVSGRDADILQTYRRPDQPVVTHIPNCIDVQNYAQVKDGTEKVYDLVFTGKMDYRPNVDGVLWFIEQIWPLVREHKRDATLAIVGKNPAPSITLLDQRGGITVTGAVAEIGPWLNVSKVMIMPLRMGSGTRLKLIEGLAAGLPIVSTTNGAEGYPVKDGKELLIADEPADFVAQIFRLLENSQRRKLMGQHGRNFAEAYDWRKVVPRFLELYQRGK